MRNVVDPNNGIRLATEGDLDVLVELTRDIPSTYGMEDLAPYSPEITRGSYLNSLRQNLLFLSEKDGKITSVLKLSVSSNWWSDQDYLINDILYAAEGKFKLNLLKEYIEIIEYISKHNNLPFIFEMINYKVDGEDDLEKKEKLFLKLFKGSSKIASTLRTQNG